MSASERLRERQPIHLTVEHLGDVTLYDVPLPLIAAVVEATETWVRLTSEVLNEDVPPPVVAALLALRDSLEKL